MLVPSENNPNNPLSVTCKLTSQLFISKPLCVHVCLLNQSHGAQVTPPSTTCFPPVNRPVSTPNCRRVGRAHGSPIVAVREYQVSTQQEILISRLFTSNLALRDQNVFPPLRKNHTYLHTHIYNFFVFTFKYKNTTLLCVINGGPSNKNFFC